MSRISPGTLLLAMVAIAAGLLGAVGAAVATGLRFRIKHCERFFQDLCASHFSLLCAKLQEQVV